MLGVWCSSSPADNASRPRLGHWGKIPSLCLCLSKIRRSAWSHTGATPEPLLGTSLYSPLRCFLNRSLTLRADPNVPMRVTSAGPVAITGLGPSWCSEMDECVESVF